MEQGAHTGRRAIFVPKTKKLLIERQKNAKTDHMFLVRPPDKKKSKSRNPQTREVGFRGHGRSTQGATTSEHLNTAPAPKKDAAGIGYKITVHTYMRACKATSTTRDTKGVTAALALQINYTADTAGCPCSAGHRSAPVPPPPPKETIPPKEASHTTHNDGLRKQAFIRQTGKTQQHT